MNIYNIVFVYDCMMGQMSFIGTCLLTCYIGYYIVKLTGSRFDCLLCRTLLKSVTFNTIHSILFKVDELNSPLKLVMVPLNPCHGWGLKYLHHSSGPISLISSLSQTMMFLIFVGMNWVKKLILQFFYEVRNGAC